MTDETKTLTEDEQFAAMMEGNPLFADGKPNHATSADDPNAQQGADAGQASAAGADAGGATEAGQGAAAGGDQGGAAAAAGDEGVAAAGASEEPFPGYNALSPEVRAAFDTVAQERRKYENDYRALHGMTAPLQRQNAELRRQADASNARIQQLEQLDRTQRNASAAKDEALNGLDEWAKQFPEESRLLMAALNPLRDQVTALEGQLNAARAELGSLASERQQAALEREVSALEKEHADWRDIHASPDYWEWLNRQTPGIQSLNNSMFAGDTVQLLNLYKSSRLAAAPAPASAPAPAPAPVAGAADAIQQRRTQALARSAAPAVRGSESTANAGGNQAGMSDDDAAFAALVGDNPNFR